MLSSYQLKWIKYDLWSLGSEKNVFAEITRVMGFHNIVDFSKSTVNRLILSRNPKNNCCIEYGVYVI
jgi:hypothetical protein